MAAGTACLHIISGLNFGSLQDSDKFENKGRFAFDAFYDNHIDINETDFILLSNGLADAAREADEDRSLGVQALAVII